MIKTGELAYVRYWKRTWIGEGKLPTSTTGHRGLPSAGDTVRVFNDRGSVEMRAAVVDRVQPGLVTMPFGWWANATSVGRGANALTNPSLGRQIGSASFHDTLVQVEKAGS